MNIDEAIAAHASWKRKLASYLEQGERTIDVNNLGADNKCALGKWLYGEGQRLASDPDFKLLVQEHARFHRAVADVVRRADAGVEVRAEIALGSNSEFGKASSSVIRALMAMKRRQAA